MTATEILFGLCITFFWTICATLNKEAVLKGHSPSEIAISNAIWMLGGITVIIATLWQQEFVPFFSHSDHFAIPLTFSALKGVSIFILVSAFSYISRHSVSSGVFALTSGLPAGSLICAIFLGEHLTDWDIFAVLAIGFTSFGFLIKGHAKRLTHKDKIAYFLLLASVTFNMVADRVSGVNCSWAVHLSVSNLSWLIVSLATSRFTKTIGRKGRKKSLFTKPLLLLGAAYLVNEINFIYSSQEVFHGIVAPFIFLRIATPIIMLIGAMKYGENKWQEQLAFGLCVVIPAIMSIAF